MEEAGASASGRARRRPRPDHDEPRRRNQVVPPLQRPQAYLSDELTDATLSEAGVPPHMIGKLQRLKVNSATRVQAEAIPRLLTHPDRDFVIHSETGSGKTLAYAVPLVARIETAAVRACRAIVVVPTRELAKQVSDVLEELVRRKNKKGKASEGAGTPSISVRKFVGEITQVRLNSLSRDPPHIAVGTPQTLAALLPAALRLGMLQTVVLDEADQLMAPHSRKATEHVLKCATRVSDRPQVVMVSATSSLALRKARETLLRKGRRGVTEEINMLRHGVAMRVPYRARHLGILVPKPTRR